MQTRESIKEFDNYLKRLITDLRLGKEEKEELEEEWKQHLYDHYASLRFKNVAEAEAIQIVIEQFGDIKKLQNEVNQTYPNSIKRHVQKELIIVAICLLASLIGPTLLISANFQIYFAFVSLQALVFAYLSYRFVVNRQTNPLLSIAGFIAIYIFFLQLLPDILGTPLTLELYLNQIFSTEWDKLTGRDGLFQFVTIHMLWYLVILLQFCSSDSYTPIWKRISNASFRYWAALLFGVMLARFQTSAEVGVLYLNIFLLYAFFQQIISVQMLVIWKEKITRLIMRKTL